MISLILCCVPSSTRKTVATFMTMSKTDYKRLIYNPDNDAVILNQVVNNSTLEAEMAWLWSLEGSNFGGDSWLPCVPYYYSNGSFGGMQQYKKENFCNA